MNIKGKILFFGLMWSISFTGKASDKSEIASFKEIIKTKIQPKSNAFTKMHGRRQATFKDLPDELKRLVAAGKIILFDDEIRPFVPDALIPKPTIIRPTVSKKKNNTRRFLVREGSHSNMFGSMIAELDEIETACPEILGPIAVIK